jgi:hypothetical protein
MLVRRNNKFFAAGAPTTLQKVQFLPPPTFIQWQDFFGHAGSVGCQAPEVWKLEKSNFSHVWGCYLRCRRENSRCWCIFHNCRLLDCKQWQEVSFNYLSLDQWWLEGSVPHAWLGASSGCICFWCSDTAAHWYSNRGSFWEACTVERGSSGAGVVNAPN